MDKIDELIASLKEDLLKEECVKQYLFYKQIIENDTSIKKLDEELRFHQKEMCKNKDNNGLYFKEKNIYEELKNRFDNHPVVINYQIAREEVFSLLVDIKRILG